MELMSQHCHTDEPMMSTARHLVVISMLCVGFCVGIADLLAALRKAQKRFQDAGRGPGPAAHPVGDVGNLSAKCK